MTKRAALLGVLGASVAALLHLAPTSAQGGLILFNASASVPEGFYWRDEGPVRRGVFATVMARDVAPHYARLRHFDGARDRFIKRIAAGGGDWVCARGDEVIVGPRRIHRFNRDALGRWLPRWQGCRRLSSGEWFLLGDGGDSFDARYWGPIRSEQIEGVWRGL